MRPLPVTLVFRADWPVSGRESVTKRLTVTLSGGPWPGLA